MGHNTIAAARLRENLIRLQKLGVFDQDTYSKVEDLLDELDRTIAERNKRQMNITLSKIARLLYEQVSTER